MKRPSGSVTIGTRGSELALWQARAVKEAIQALEPALDVRLKVISTTGDRLLDAPLESIGDKGLFTSDLEAALSGGRIDLCVHSMKDVPSQLAEGCAIAAMLPREDARDALVCGPRITARSLQDVPAGSRLGTGSLRRSAQILMHFPGIVPKPVRGNVDTRLRKAMGPDYEGAVLAVAGLSRLGLSDRIAAYLPVSQMVPAAGQGAIGVEIRGADERMMQLCKGIDDPETSLCVGIERAVLKALEGGCRTPVGIHARIDGSSILVDAIVSTTDGVRAARVHQGFERSGEAHRIADAVVRELVDRGASEILSDMQNFTAACSHDGNPSSREGGEPCR